MKRKTLSQMIKEGDVINVDFRNKKLGNDKRELKDREPFWFNGTLLFLDTGKNSSYYPKRNRSPEEIEEIVLDTLTAYFKQNKALTVDMGKRLATMVLIGTGNNKIDFTRDGELTIGYREP
jgi:hypothetical protein